MSQRFVQVVAILVCAAGACAATDKPAATSTVKVQASTARVVYVATLRNGFSIRFDHRELRAQTSRLFLDANGSSFVDVSTGEIVNLETEEVPVAVPETVKSARVDIPSAIAAASDRHGIDADLLYSVIRAESDFNPHAVSRKGARGLMQLMPETAGKLGVTDAFDTASNVDAGTKYLRELLDRYHYDLAKALAAYNAGPARVDQYHGVPPFHETRMYVARIIREYNRAVLSRRKAVAGHRTAATNPPLPIPTAGQ